MPRTHTAQCNTETSADCDTGMNGSGSGSSGTGGGLSSGCETAINDCLQQTQTLLQGTSLPDCGSTLLSACMDPNNVTDCQNALTACANDVQGVQSNAGSIADQCGQEITAACQ